jgi:hypothetical protein
MHVNECIFPNSGIKLCKKSNHWIASLNRNGSEIFLGAFPTQTQAYQATRIAMGVDDGHIERDVNKARMLDMQATSMEAVVDAFEKQYVPSIHAFSLHNYTIQRLNHYCYLEEMKEFTEQQAGKSASPEKKAPAPQEERKSKRKQGQPQRECATTTSSSLIGDASESTD